jgi:outer membrane protein OmpA-like peptidoglycan-associated protein
MNTLDKRSLGGIADALGESDQTISRGMPSAMGTVLGGMASKFDNPSLLRKILDLVPSGTGGTTWTNLAGSVADQSSPLMSAGRGMLSTLFGSSEGMITRALGTGTGLQSGITSSLLTMAAPMVMSFLSRRVRDEGMSMGGLGNLLQREIPAIRSVVPSGVSDLLWPHERETAAASPVIAQTVKRERSSAAWVIPLVLLALIPALWWLTRARRPVVITPSVPTGAANRIVPETPAAALPKSVDLYFETGSSKLRPDSQAKLQEFTAALPPTTGNAATAGNALVVVLVKGFTDNVGNAASNVRLSQARADAVRGDLIRRGVTEDRVTAQGFGEEQPAADNATAEGRQANRHVTVEAATH